MVAEKRGRPSDYTPEIAARICAELAEGKSLRKVCEADDLPSEVTVRTWVLEDREGFSAQYTRAREFQADAIFDESFEIADGKGDVNRDRLRVDTRKWALARMAPKRYGEKVTQVHEGGDKPVDVNILSPVEVRERMARILRGTMTESDDRADPGDGAGDDPNAGS